jgi:hypothetical protein
MQPAFDTPSNATAHRSWNRFWILRRITSGSSWIPEIDGLHFIMIAVVVLFHLSGQASAKSLTTFVV